MTLIFGAASPDRERAGAIDLPDFGNHPHRIGVRIIAAADARAEYRVLAKWDQLLKQNSGTTLFYQSPGYFHHLASLRRDCAYLAIVERACGTPIGIVPLRKSPVLLKFEARDYRLAKISFSGVRLLGGTLLVPPSPEVFGLLFREIARSFPDCDAMEVSGLSTASLLWDVLKDSHSLRRDFAIYAPHGPRNCHTASVPASFAEYLKAFGHKKQYNLRRQVRRLNSFGNGSLSLLRIDNPAVIGCFQNAWAALGGRANRDGGDLSESELLDLAERGLLLSYVLTVNGAPCSLAVGTRFQDTMLLHSFRHDARIDRLSPGTVLQTLMMKDLIEGKLARRIDYGFGEPQYRLTNHIDERVTAIVVRKSMINRALMASHRLYVRLLNAGKRRVSS